MSYQYNPTNNLWSRPGFDGIAYSDGQDFEDHLLSVIQQVSDRSVFSPELKGKIFDWRSEYHLTTARHCLLRPIEFKPGERVLELGCGCGAITRYLGEQGLQVTAVEGGARRAEVTAERCRDLPNVQVILEDLVHFDSDEAYDWVTLIGVLEYSPLFAKGEDPVLAYLSQAIRYVKPGGRLIVAIENQLGLKYFNGCGEDHVGTPFYGPQDLYNPRTAVTFGRRGLEQRLLASGFSNVDFFYPFPDYKIPSAVVSDQAFKHPEFKVADLLMRIEARDYGERNLRLFTEQLVARTLEDNGLLQHFANSFTAIASKNNDSLLQADTPLAWCFSLGREAQYQTETIFRREGEQIAVDKHLINPRAASNTPNTEDIQHRVGRSTYRSGRLLAWPILKAKLSPDADRQLGQAFEDYAQYVLSLSRPAAGSDPQQLASWQIAGDYLDLTPFNLVRTANGLQAIDQEWVIPSDIPTGWVLMRGIIQTVGLGIGHPSLSNTTLSTLLTAIVAPWGIGFDNSSLEAWQNLEALFLRTATGRKLPQPQPDDAILHYNNLRKLDLDHLDLAGSSAPDGRGKARRPSLEQQYAQWLEQRKFIPEDIKIIEQSLATVFTSQPLFQILIRLTDGQQALLAETLDSLNNQFYSHWRVDVVANVAPPPGMADLPNFAWHVQADLEQAFNTLNFVTVANKGDWILETPPGSVLDPLCLWRIGHEAHRAKESTVFYTDDDQTAGALTRLSPRFKPELDPEWLRCADIIGPIFVRRDVWRQAGGASQENTAPWYDLLFRVMETVDRNTITHIPDVLLSLPCHLASNIEQQAATVSRHLARQKEAASVSLTSDATCHVTHELSATPLVSLIVTTHDSLEFLEPCIVEILEKTAYPHYELLIVDCNSSDPQLLAWLHDLPQRTDKACRVIKYATSYDTAQALALGAAQAAGSFVVFLKEDTRILQGHWLDELLRQCQRPGIGAVTPRLVQPQSGLIENIGQIPGLAGMSGSLHREELDYAAEGYLHCIQSTREISAAPLSCLMVKKAAYDAVDGIDGEHLHSPYADLDLCLKLRRHGQRILYTPAVTVADYNGASRIPILPDAAFVARETLNEEKSREWLYRQWADALASDGSLNPNLSREHETLGLETGLLPTWRYLPAGTPRILARTLHNGQGAFRVSMPLLAAQKAGLVQSCDLRQDSERTLSPIEISQLNPDTYLVQHFLSSAYLLELQQYRKLRPDSFIVYTCDDVITDMPLKSSFRKGVPANARSRLRTALQQCNRLVVSTDFLADIYQDFIDDIVVVPNRLEGHVWLPLQTERNTGPKPRIGWAGGEGHQGDLELLKTVIEATRAEADWVFFGMCPDEIRPLIAEFHESVAFEKYPAKLASVNLDIAVAPLETIPFNQGKSNLRLLEYGALGLPVVCTDIDPYRNSPAQCVSNHPAAWIAALRERIHDRDAATREGEAMKKWVVDHFILEDFSKDWLSAHLP